MAQDPNGRSNAPPSSSGDLPADLVDRLAELDESELRAVLSYGRSLLPEPPTVEDLLEECGEELLDVEAKEGYTAVVKEQPCATGCDDCPHGPYLYHVRVEKHPEQGERPSLHWKFIGPVHE
ncbi:hypothetical protein M0R88_17945 [Halorussus gelatinilyticus]|uniref:Uncharacterized protein n=1 Tax=Halorussus gelatinilyticus TaxID=2937524 RepID=A0A8U0IJE2_9EURY|nr:hypothetical protein [Halorussus gelatinilyticus]UPW00374.1 hypothetical protein M0R88_17945 [Halorussus gelatinilyticus]